MELHFTACADIRVHVLAVAMADSGESYGKSLGGRLVLKGGFELKRSKKHKKKKSKKSKKRVRRLGTLQPAPPTAGYRWHPTLVGCSC